MSVRLLRITHSIICGHLGRSVRLLSVSQSVTNGSGFREEELKILDNSESGITRTYLPPRDKMGGFSDKRVVVMMVGWVESRHSVLSKYAALYTELGLPCVAVAPSAPYVWYTALGNSATQNVLHLLDHAFKSPTDLLLHIFSGGGSVVFPQLLHEHSKPNGLYSKLTPTGVVFDSGPVRFSRKSGLAASKLLYQQGGLNLLTYSLANVVGILTDLTIGSKKRSELQESLDHPTFLQLPQLYLFSDRDSVCSAKLVQEVMEGQKVKGREVWSHCWDDTEHVKHFVQHPEEYGKKIMDFMRTASKDI